MKKKKNDTGRDFAADDVLKTQAVKELLKEKYANRYSILEKLERHEAMDDILREKSVPQKEGNIWMDYDDGQDYLAEKQLESEETQFIGETAEQQPKYGKLDALEELQREAKERQLQAKEEYLKYMDQMREKDSVAADPCSVDYSIESRGYPGDDDNALQQTATFNPSTIRLKSRKWSQAVPSDRVAKPNNVFGNEYEQMELLPELESSKARILTDVEMFDNVRSDLVIYRVPERTLIYAIVVDKKGELNKTEGIACCGGIALGGYARDVSGDVYLIECCDNLNLGTVPLGFRLEVPRTGSWSARIPIPVSVLDQVFAPQQRKILMALLEKYPSDRFEINYLQMLLAN